MHQVLAEPDFSIDLKAMRTFQELLESHHFDEVARIPVSTYYASIVGESEARICRFRNPVSIHPAVVPRMQDASQDVV